jgi:hypothetical protein
MPYQVNAPARSDPAKDYGDLDGLVRGGDRRRAYRIGPRPSRLFGNDCRFRRVTAGLLISRTDLKTTIERSRLSGQDFFNHAIAALPSAELDFTPALGPSKFFHFVRPLHRSY